MHVHFLRSRISLDRSKHTQIHTLADTRASPDWRTCGRTSYETITADLAAHGVVCNESHNSTHYSTLPLWCAHGRGTVIHERRNQCHANNARRPGGFFSRTDSWHNGNWRMRQQKNARIHALLPMRSCSVGFVGVCCCCVTASKCQRSRCGLFRIGLFVSMFVCHRSFA